MHLVDNASGHKLNANKCDFAILIKSGVLNYKDLTDDFLNSEDSEPVTEELITREIFESFNKEIIQEESDELDVQEEIFLHKKFITEFIFFC